MPISSARAAAFEILMRIETTDAYASELLHSSRFAQLSPADHGLLTELVMGVLRWRGLLDEMIAEHSSQAISKLDLEVLTALRLGAYQILFLDRVPKHAAVNESVELVKRAHKRSASGLVNAVLRKIDKASPVFEKHALQEQGHRSLRGLSHPQWLVERWEDKYGSDAAQKICESDQSTPKSAIRIADFLSPKFGMPNYPTMLGADGTQLEPGKLLSGAFTVTAGDISRSTAFRDRRIAIQDEA